jgi:bromodomain-containing protein 8
MPEDLNAFIIFSPLDEWNTHEQLCLASAVACSGDQNWMSVSRAIKGIVNSVNSRPADWFHSKLCATQYGKLLESVETPKRKKVSELLKVLRISLIPS